MADTPKRGPGRPRLNDGEGQVRVNVSLSPQTVAILRASPLGASREIERLVAQDRRRG